MDGSLVTPCVFDSSLSCAAATDYLLTELSKYAIFCFNSLTTDDTSMNMEEKIVNAASKNGLLVHGRFVKRSSDGKFSG